MTTTQRTDLAREIGKLQFHAAQVYDLAEAANMPEPQINKLAEIHTSVCELAWETRSATVED